MKVIFMLVVMLTIQIKGNIWDNIVLEKPDYEFPSNGKVTISKSNVDYVNIIYSEVHNTIKIELLSTIKQIISISNVIGDLLNSNSNKDAQNINVMLSVTLDFNLSVICLEYKGKCDYIENMLPFSLSTNTLIKFFDLITYGDLNSNSLVLEDLGVSVKSNKINSNIDSLRKNPIDKLKELRDSYSFALNAYALLSGKQWIKDLLNINLDELDKVDYKIDSTKYNILFTIDDKSNFINSLIIKNKITSEIIEKYDVLFESLEVNSSHSLLNLKNYNSDCNKIENEEKYYIELVKDVLN